MTRSDLTHLYFLLDRSGSMQSIKSDIEGGFAAFIDEQRKAARRVPGEPGPVRRRLRGRLRRPPARRRTRPRPAARATAPPCTTRWAGLITEAGEKLAALPEDERPGTVIVAIMTDGLENASQEWHAPAIKALVELQTKQYGWEFLYMGADQDAVEVGAGLGIAAGNSVTYSRGKAREAMAMSAGKIRRTCAPTG